MLTVLLEGTLTEAPVLRTGGKGNLFATAHMRVAGEDGQAVTVEVIAYCVDAAEVLAVLKEGDAAAIVGTASLTHCVKQDGSHKVGVRVTARRVMTIGASKPRRATYALERVAC